MLEIKKKYKDPRRTIIISNEKAYKVEDLETLKAKMVQMYMLQSQQIHT